MASWKDEARRRAKELKEGESFKLKEGANCFRILPSIKKGAKPFIEFRVHRDVGPEKAFLRCGHHPDGSGKCWLCTKIAEIADKKPDYADRMMSKVQMLTQIARFDSETGKFSKPKPWWVPSGGRKSLSIQVLSMLGNPKRDYEDPIKGRNWNIERTGSGFKDTRYDPIIEDEEATKVPQSVLALLKPLWDFAPKYSEVEQKAAYFGKKAEDVEEEVAEEETETETEETEETETEETEETETEEEEVTEEAEETEETEAEETEETETEGEETETTDFGEETETEEEEEAPKPKAKKPTPKPAAKKPAPKPEGRSKK